MLNPIFTNSKDFISPIMNYKIKIDNLENNISVVEEFYSTYKNKQYEANSDIRSFLEKLFYSDYKIFDGEKLENGSGKFDLAIADDTNDRYKVLIELKNPNSSDMMEKDNFFKKAFYQAIYYYLSDKHNTLFEQTNSSKVKFLIITNYTSWYFIRTSDIDALDKISRFPSINNIKTEQAYASIEQHLKSLEDKNSILPDLDLPYTSFDLNEIFSDRNSLSKKSDLEIFLKMLSPQYLLEKADGVDKNKITNKFYKELFYIIGLEETSKNLLEPLDNNFSFLALIKDELPHHLLEDKKNEIAMELVLIWISRILFIQLFSSVLIKYKIINEPILSVKYCYSFDDINTLFFEILNSDMRQKNFRKELNFNKIPYINSALFQKSDIENTFNISIKNLSSGRTVEIFKDSKVDVKTDNGYADINILEYLIKFLNSYDIAVDENFSDNSNKDLINASVLGMVFERLNGYKDGSFYTPSYITEYMSNATIKKVIIQKFNESGFSGNTIEEIGDNIGRKQIDEAKTLFSSITICDSAVGSGHFLVSSLNAMLLYKAQLGLFEHIKYHQASIIDDMFVINDLGSYDKNKISTNIHDIYKELYKTKEEIIGNSIFGVDINPKSVYIARLRLWIELLKHTYFTDSNQLILLPNIDINIKQGNSLISDFELDSNINSLVDNDTFYTYKNLVKEYKNPDNSRANLLEKIEKIKYKMDNRYDEKNKFEWRYEFPEILDTNGNFIGFDIVISNPPYMGEKGNKEIFRLLKEYYKDKYEKNSDLFYFFFIKSIDILKENGTCGFITTNYFLTADSAIKLRKELQDKTVISDIINFNEMKLFNSALGQHNIITIFKKSINIVDTNIINVVSSENIPHKELFINSEKVEVFTVKSNELFDGNQSYMRISEQSIKLENIFKKITNDSKTLDEICFVNTGFNSGADRVTNSNSTQAYKNRPQDIKLRSGIFILNEEEYKKIKPEKELVYKCYKSSDVDKYYSNKWKNIYVIWTNKNLDIKKYPNIENHLKKYKKILELKREYHTGQLPWFSQHWAREYSVFGNTDKIVFPYRSKSNIFSYSNNDYFGSKDILYLRQKDKSFYIKYLLALLNSKLYYTWLYYKGKRKGETLELYATPIKNIPIKNIVEKDQEPFVKIVDEIIKQKEANQDTKKLEKELNNMIYKLYNLNADEIKIIEHCSKSKVKTILPTKIKQGLLEL